jgi:hypothetical protein
MGIVAGSRRRSALIIHKRRQRRGGLFIALTAERNPITFGRFLGRRHFIDFTIGRGEPGCRISTVSIIWVPKLRIPNRMSAAPMPLLDASFPSELRALPPSANTVHGIPGHFSLLAAFA